jgi:hypothetical protein
MTYQVKQPVRTLGREALCHLIFLGNVTSWLILPARSMKTAHEKVQEHYLLDGLYVEY